MFVEFEFTVFISPPYIYHVIENSIENLFLRIYHVVFNIWSLFCKNKIFTFLMKASKIDRSRQFIVSFFPCIQKHLICGFLQNSVKHWLFSASKSENRYKSHNQQVLLSSRSPCVCLSSIYRIDQPSTFAQFAMWMNCVWFNRYIYMHEMCQPMYHGLSFDWMWIFL